MFENTCLLSLLWVPVIAGASAPENLVRNGDFAEDANQDGTPDHWSVSAGPDAVVERVEGEQGRGARIHNASQEQSVYLRQNLEASRLAGKRVRFEARVKAENVVRGPQPYSLAKATLVINDQGSGPEVAWEGTFDWKTLTATWKLPADLPHAVLHLGLHTCSGTVWFDEVQLYELTPVATREVGKGVVQQEFPGGDVLLVDGVEFTESRPPEEPSLADLTAEERERGFVVFIRDRSDGIFPRSQPQRAEVVRELNAWATPGEYEPVTFALHALRAPATSFRAGRGRVSVTVEDLQGPEGTRIDGPALDLRAVRFMVQRDGFAGNRYHVVPKLLDTNLTCPLREGENQQFWLTVHVPEEAPAGIYRGAVRLTMENGGSQTLPLTLEVLPFRLVEPIWWGIYYYSDFNPHTARDFRDMRAHGMTSLLYCPPAGRPPLSLKEGRVEIDFTTCDQLMALAKEVGFRGPVPFYPRLLTSELLRLFGREKDFPPVDFYGATAYDFQAKDYPDDLRPVFQQLIRDIWQHAQEADWLPLVFYPVDEPGMGSWVMEEAQVEYPLARAAVPEARMLCTVYSLEQMQALDPWIDIRVCDMWSIAGEEGNRQIFADAAKSGDEVWGIRWLCQRDDFFYPRHVAGFLAEKVGVTGMTEWTYYGAASLEDPYHDLRGGIKTCAYAYVSPQDGSLLSTLPWEGVREGIDDSRYLRTLRAFIGRAAASDQPAARAAAQRAQAALEEILNRVPWGGDWWGQWSEAQARQSRREIADLIQGVQRILGG